MSATPSQARRRLAASIQMALFGALLLTGTAHAAGSDAAPAAASPAAPDDQKKHDDNTTTLSGIQVKADAAAPTAAYAGGQVANGGRFGVLGNQDLMNVPFSMTSYTDKLIRDQQAHTLGDVVSNDPAVRTGFGYGNYSQAFTIRGFQLDSDDIGFDGLYGLLPRQLIAPELVSRVEVFKGASAFLNGISPGGSGIGGSINVAPKRADVAPLTRVGVDYGSNGQVGESIDIGRRFGAGNAFGVRVNAVHREGSTAIDGENSRETALGIAFDYQGEKLRVTTDLGYQKRVIDGGRSTVFLGAATEVPRAPSAKTNYSQPWSGSSLEDTFGVVRAEYDFTPWLTGYVAAGAHHGNEYGDYISPTLTDNRGDATESRFTVPYIADTASGEAGFNAHFETGDVTHRVNVGFSALSTNKKAGYAGSAAFATNLYSPVDVARPGYTYNVGPISDPGFTGRTQLRSMSVSDTLGFFDDAVSLTLGARRQKLHVLGYDYAVDGVDGAKNAEYEKYVTSPIIGLNWRISEQFSVYANHIEALTQGDTAPTLFNGVAVTNAGQVFAPYRSKQNELGLKWDAGNFGSSLGLFQIKKASGYVDNSTNTYVINGEQRNRGVEWSFFGEPVHGLRLLGGANYIKPELVDTENGTNDGHDAIGVPRFQANAGAEWDIPNSPDITLSARAVRTGKQYLDVANSLKVPAWTTYDVGARATTSLEGVPVTFRLTVQNIMNKGYWASATGGYLTQGTPRTFLVSASFDF